MPNTPRRAVSRRASSLANDERILDAALALLIERGPDGFTLRDVAAAVGLSHTAVYARYDDRDELLAELWQRRCCAEVGRLVDLAALPGADGVPELLAADQVLEDPAVHAAVVLCATSSRLRDAGDIVPRDVVAALRRSGIVGEDGVQNELALGFVALLVGTVMVGPVLASAHRNVAVARSAVVAGRRNWTGPPPPRFVTPPFRFAVDETVQSRLLVAAAAVIADSGVAHATLKRIGRRAWMAPTALYAVYPTREEMLLDLVRRHADYDDGAERTVALVGAAHAHASLVAGWCDPAAHEPRRLLLEIYSAAAHDPLEREVLVAAWAEVAERHAGDLGTTPELHATARLMIDIGATIDIGAAVLAEVCGPAGVDLSTCDWRPFASSLMRGLRLVAAP